MRKLLNKLGNLISRVIFHCAKLIRSVKESIMTPICFHTMTSRITLRQEWLVQCFAWRNISVWQACSSMSVFVNDNWTWMTTWLLLASRKVNYYAVFLTTSSFYGERFVFFPDRGHVLSELFSPKRHWQWIICVSWRDLWRTDHPQAKPVIYTQIK
jgi:hypothetical protein